MSEYRNYDDEWLLHSDNYCKHVSAMTREKLHSKADIAAELAYRDDRITELEAELKEAHQDAGFYRCCALSGEIPKEGSQPSALPPKEKDDE